MTFAPCLRAYDDRHPSSSSGCPGEALVELLIDRGDRDDLAEAHRIVDQWQAQRPGIPGLDLWWLKSRAVLAGAEGDADGYAELAEAVPRDVRKAHARGRLDEARLMVSEAKAPACGFSTPGDCADGVRNAVIVERRPTIRTRRRRHTVGPPSTGSAQFPCAASGTGSQ